MKPGAGHAIVIEVLELGIVVLAGIVLQHEFLILDHCCQLKELDKNYSFDTALKGTKATPYHAEKLEGV